MSVRYHPVCSGLILVLVVLGTCPASVAADPATPIWSITPVDDRGSPEILLTGPREIGRIRLWVPEAVMSVPGAAAIYPQGSPWVREREHWRQTSMPDALFAKQQVQRVDDRTIEFHKLRLELAGPVKWETEVQSRENAVTFSIKLTNTGPREIKQAAAAVCVKFLEGKRWWSAEQAYVVCDERLRPLTELGHTESRFYRPNPFQLYLLREAKFENPFYHQVWGVNEHRLSRPLMISQHREAGQCIVVSAERAYFLHCNRSNPCTDLMLAFGDLKPGQSAESKGQVQLRRGTAAEIVARK